ncbi:MAG: hypothetical protein ABI743_05115, partial [bacterium]
AIDDDDDPLTVEIDWDNNGSYEDTRTLNSGQTPTWTAPNQVNNPGAAGARTIKLRYTDGLVTPINHANLTYTLGVNRPPQVIGGDVNLYAPDIAAPGLFVVQDNGLNVVDPEGDGFRFVISNSLNAEESTGRSLPLPAHQTPFLAEQSPVEFTVIIQDDDGIQAPVVVGTLTGTVHGAAWARRMGGTIDEQMNTLLVTADRIYCGINWSSPTDFGGGPRPLVGNYDCAIAAYSLDGTYLWDRTFGSSGSDSIQGLAVNAAGDIWVVGGVTGNTDFGGGSRTSATPRSFIASYSSTGAHLSSRFLSTSALLLEDIGMDVAVAADDSLLCVGFYQGGTINLGGGPQDDGTADGLASYVVSLTPAGAFTGASYFNTGTLCLLDELIIDPTAATAYTVGLFEGNQDFGGGAFVQMDGSLLLGLTTSRGWRFQHGFAHTTINSLGLLPDGFGVAMGGTYSLSTDFGGGSRIYNGGGSDGMAITYTVSGTYADDRVISGTGYEAVNGLAVDGAGNVIVAGDFDMAINFGGGTRTPTVLNDGFVIKYNPTLDWQWDAVYTGPKQSQAISVGTTPGGDVIPAGHFTDSLDADPGPGTHLLFAPAVDRFDVFLGRLRGDSGRW